MNKIRLVHIVYSFEVGGIETLLLSLLNGLDKQKYDITLLSVTNNKLSLASSLEGHITVRSLNLIDSKRKKLFSALSTIIDLRKVLNEIKPDIIHNHLTAGSFFITSLALKSLNFDFVQIKTIHTAGAFFSSKKVLDKFRLIVEKSALKMNKTNIIAVSRAVENNNNIHFNNIANDLKLIYNGIDLSKFNPNNFYNVSKGDFGVSNDCFLVTYVARLDHGKNHNFLIDLWPKVLKEVPEAKLCFAGEGTLRDDLIINVKKHGYEDSIIFLGSITNVPDLLSVSDIAVFPSSFEGFGLVLLEYFAMRLATVASDIEPFKEIANDGDSAFLVSLRNSAQFANRIIELYKNETLRQRIGENAFNIAQNFSVEQTIRLHDEYYSECLLQALK